MKEETFQGTGGVEIFTRSWRPATGKPRAVLVSVHGFKAYGGLFDWAGEQFKGGTVAYQNVTTVVTAELAYTTDIETFKTHMAGMDHPTQWSNRVTHVFRRLDGEWRLLHRHANRLETQYEPSTRLK